MIIKKIPTLILFVLSFYLSYPLMAISGETCNLVKESQEVTSLYTEKAKKAKTTEQARKITNLSPLFIEAAQHLAKGNEKGCELYATIREKLDEGKKKKEK